jgi:hypothetical protein
MTIQVAHAEPQHHECSSCALPRGHGMRHVEMDEVILRALLRGSKSCTVLMSKITQDNYVRIFEVSRRSMRK